MKTNNYYVLETATEALKKEIKELDEYLATIDPSVGLQARIAVARIIGIINYMENNKEDE